MPRRPLCAVCLALVLLLYIGIRLAGDPLSPYEAWEGRNVSLTGRVYKIENTGQMGDRVILYLRLIAAEEGLYPAGTGETVNIICYLKSDQITPEIGSVVRVKGTLRCFEQASNPGQFDAKSYYQVLKLSFQLNQTEIQAKSNTYYKLSEALFNLREHFSGILTQYLLPEDASVMRTMLLGEKKVADEEIKSLYQRNGIAHVLAISGLHMSFLGMMLCKLLKRLGLPVWLQTLVPMGVLILYGIMTGFSVSSLRAVIMFGIQMAALLLGRTYDLITAAALSAVLLLLDQPYYLFYSGFLFSFGCVFAIGLLVPALTVSYTGERLSQPGKGLAVFLSAVAITMAGLPLQLYFFYQMPIYSVFLNLLIIPLMSLLLPGGILLLLAGSAGLPAEFPAAIVTGILEIYKGACRFCEMLPFAKVLPGRPKLWQIALYLFFLMVVVIFQKRLSLKKKWMVVLCGGLLLFLPGKSTLQITFLDVGQGDCIYIHTEAGTNFLIDGGSSSVSSVGIYRILPYLKEQGAGMIEGVFVTHPDEDHCNGIKELLVQGSEEGIKIKKLYLPDVGEDSRTESYLALEEAARKAGVLVDYVSKEEGIRQGELSLMCLHPEEGWESRDANEYSLVFLLRYGEFQALFTGDVEGEGERQLLQVLKEYQVENITLLKASHHGSAYSTPEELLSILSPAMTVISCGENNSYGHPHPELLGRLAEVQTEIYITYDTGAITFQTDGKKLSIETFLEK